MSHKDYKNDNMPQRGRKPKTDEDRFYFVERQEQAVKDYLNSTDQAERDEIFNTILKPAFTKMIESIMRRYKLFVPDEEFDNTFNDIMSFLATKMDKYHPEKNKKAYSYYGTICKNQLIYKINQFKKKVERNEPFDETYERLQNNLDFSTDAEGGTFTEDLMNGTVAKIKEMVDDDSYGLTENEKKTGLVLCNLLENWDSVLADDGSNKLQKSQVLYYLRENTMLTTKEVRDNMRKFKFAYYELKKKMMDDE